MDLSDGSIHPITTSEGETIRLYGRINNNIIYGFAYLSDIAILADGSRLLPAYKLCIEDGHGNIMKTYTESGYYVNGVGITENMLTLKRLKRLAGVPVTYEAADDDSIMNRYTEPSRMISVTKRITDRILTEYYISLPSSVDIAETPVLTHALNTVINFDTTTRVSEPEGRTGQFYAYSFGEVIFADTSVAKTIAAADAATGTVLDPAGKVVWERGIKTARSEIAGVKTVDADAAHSSVQAAMKMVLLHKNLDTDTASFDVSKESVFEWMSRNMKSTVLDMTGASLDEILYYVYKSRPVIAIKTDGTAVVITGYDAVSVTVYEPAKKKSVKYSTKEATAAFSGAGNIFVAYVD